MRVIKVCLKHNVKFWIAEKSPFISRYKRMFIHVHYCLLNTTYFFENFTVAIAGKWYHYFYFPVRESSKLNNISAVHYQI